MKISKAVWDNFTRRLSMLDDAAAQKVTKYINEHDVSTDEGLARLIQYSHAVATKYGEGSAALSAQMYDAVAALQNADVPPAVPAQTATYNETARAVQGARLFSEKAEVTAGAVSRLVKTAGADTTLQNAARDGAQFAWVPSGDTCAFCITLASRGWQRMSRKAIEGGHAEHIHNNCDCTYAIRFSDKDTVEGYDPEVYKQMYYGAEGTSPKAKINYMRRQFYAKNKGIVGAGSSKAEDFIFTPANKAIQAFENKAKTLKKERAIITTPGGEIYAQSQGGGRSVSIQGPSQAGYIFSHNHPVPANFSVQDIVNFEKHGYKQIRAVSPERTYIVEAIDPKKKGDGEDLFATAMYKEWERLDNESKKKRAALNEAAKKIVDRAERSKYASRIAKEILNWRNKAEDEWLRKNAPKYGYRYTTLIN